ncbi:GHMP family kinase ATP-binding protein [Desulfomonile tiedjei]|uniref:Putative kinase, galactokinase/mevalonate kinase n=1 Tax=Desulfomonile tiedjei (strain ATCC 49306 / DSM 6799 / DCB-1) TaxID=706587 RepID=I4CB82_DESTA|nr:GHMP kinase [Desulfomonile tiedjei]AFM26823.1 putative kinase, galactokinase/mevalonate kinase [Desulfomonile tiedjei DSM 6799]
MIITRTPLRVSFCGGGTDLPSYYLHRQGAVVSTSINKYVYITINPLTPYFQNRILIKYSRTELVDSVDEIRHPIIREAMKITGVVDRVEITSMADIPAGTGLGSSSSYAVGLLHALHTYKGEYVSAAQLAAEACEIEIKRLGDPIGKQDQYIAAYGGICHIRFNTDESVFVDPVICPQATKLALEENLLMFYTGLTRRAGDILEVQNSVTLSKMDVLTRMRDLCDEALKVLQSGRSLNRFGEILHEAWLNKRSVVDSISNDSINEFYEKARSAGAIGGKLLGAGGGGFLLFYVEKQNQDRVKQVLGNLQEMPFTFEPQGSKVIYVSDV